MLVNVITPKIYNQPILPEWNKENNQPKLNPALSNSNALMSQLSFMAATNAVKSGFGAVLDCLPASYRENLVPIKVGECTILGRRGSDDNTVIGKIMLLDTPMGFADAIIALAKKITDFERKFRKIPSTVGDLSQGLNDVDLCLYHTSFDYYLKAIRKQPELKDIQIRGIIGQGGSSTAFLTANNTVVKLSPFRNFPLEKAFIEEVDIPVLDSYVIDTPPLELYVAHVPFAKEASILGVSDEDFLGIFNQFRQKINPYSFDIDFGPEACHKKQVGFLAGKPYLLDPECIVRPGFNNFFHPSSLLRNF
ncbi:MAG: hypothetical protein PHC64_05035 [Candidatus Gastranaerophilales bacterium]|nr:hypothetical protein [Candidatus Gastranaerophilales bacterium]